MSIQVLPICPTQATNQYEFAKLQVDLQVFTGLGFCQLETWALKLERRKMRFTSVPNNVLLYVAWV